MIENAQRTVTPTLAHSVSPTAGFQNQPKQQDGSNLIRFPNMGDRNLPDRGPASLSLLSSATTLTLAQQQSLPVLSIQILSGLSDFVSLSRMSSTGGEAGLSSSISPASAGSWCSLESGSCMTPAA